jgi:murein DD-endopeptidase MepM/ murein hydrolase activator NlpD
VKSRRYTIVVADRTTGVVRRFTISLRPTLTAVAILFSLPVLIGLGARWSALAEVKNVREANATLEIENQSFRSMTTALTGQVEGVQSAISELTAKAKLDPESARALAKLPSAVKTRAMGGGTSGQTFDSSLFSPSLTSPDNMFGQLREELGRLADRINKRQQDYDRRTELLNVTPSIWPAQGSLSATWGVREDPFGRGQETHTGIDISADRGAPVYATGDGTVTSAGWNGDYGNMVVIDHGWGLVTRYAHLSVFSVRSSERVLKGQVIGQVGSTGRSTGAHLHYELMVNGQLTNPLSLIAGSRRP